MDMLFSFLQLFSPASVSALRWEQRWTQLKLGFADFNQDCEINILDRQAVAVRYGSFFGLLLYNQRYDVEPDAGDGIPDNNDDWDIDIMDLQFVWGRDGFTCVATWDPKLSMGQYSYKSNTPTGPRTACGMPVTYPPGSAYYVDPIGIVFYNNASASRLKQELPTRGLPVLEDDNEQRFWEVGRCSFEDVDAAENAGGCCPVCIPWCLEPDAWERMHTRCEEANQESGTTRYMTLGIFSVCTPHFDDDDEGCHLGGLWGGHFVPEVYPYPWRISPEFQGSGFDAGREWLRQQFGSGGVTSEYWGNRTPIHQSCGQDQDPASNGWVYKIPIY